MWKSQELDIVAMFQAMQEQMQEQMREQMKALQQSVADAFQKQSAEIRSLTEEIVMIKSKSTPPEVTVTPPDTETSVPIQTSNESGNGLKPAIPLSAITPQTILSVKIRDPTKF